MLVLTLIPVGILLPGYCLARRLIRGIDPLELAVYTVALGLFAIPTAVYSISLSTGIPFGRFLILGMASVIVVACRPWNLPPVSKTAGRSFPAVLALIGFAVVLLEFTQIRAGHSLQVFTPCLNAQALYLIQHHASGLSLFAPELGHGVTHVLQHPSTPITGLETILTIQRPINGSVLAVGMCLAGRAGFEVTTLLFFFVIAGAATLVARRYIRKEAGCVVVGLATLAGMHGLIAYMVNETVFSMAGGLVALSLFLRNARGIQGMITIGFVLGFAVASRQVAVLWLVPALLFFWRFPFRYWLAAAGGFIAALSPTTLTTLFVTGSPIYEPINYIPFNWPVHDTLVHHSLNVLPPLFRLPIFLLHSAGSVLVSAMTAGFVLLWRKRVPRIDKWIVIGWGVPIPLLLHLLVYIDYEKASWLLLGMPIVPMLLARFAADATDRGPRLPILAGFVALSVLLAFVPRWLADFESPEDTRLYDIPTGSVPEPPRHEKAERKALARIAVIPSLQEVVHESRLWTSLPHSYDEPAFASGRTIVWQQPDVRSMDVGFPMQTTVEERSLMDFSSACEPDGMAEYANFVVHLQIESAQRVEVRTLLVPNGIRVEIDPGPLPHQVRHLTFYLGIDVYEDVRNGIVTVGGKEVTARLSAFFPADGDTNEPGMIILTNLQAPKMPPGVRHHRVRSWSGQ